MKKIEIGFSFSGRGYEVSAVSNWGRLQMPFGGAINDLALLHHYLLDSICTRQFVHNGLETKEKLANLGWFTSLVW